MGGDGRGVVGFVIGLLTNCIVGFIFAFPVSSLGGSMEALLRQGFVGTFWVQSPKILWRALIGRSCSSHI